MIWVKTSEEKPRIGEWVLMYLKKYGGCSKFRAGMYDHDGWLSTANCYEGKALLTDEDVLYWQPLPAPPSIKGN